MTLIMVDTSVLMRGGRNADVQKFLTDVITDGTAATCPIIELEMGFAARNPAMLAKSRRSRGTRYVDLAFDDRAAIRAKNVQRFLADKGLHRAAPAADLMIAAVAELNGAILVHYDADFEHIASVSGLQQRWVVERGSID